MKRADSACSVDRLVWRKFIELLHAHFPGPVSSRVLKTSRISRRCCCLRRDLLSCLGTRRFRQFST